MDPISVLAATAVAALAPYLAEAGKEFAKEPGKSAANKIGTLYQALKTRFKDKPAAKEALADLKASPNDVDAQAALRLQLKKQMQIDRTFIDVLRKLLDEIEQDKSSLAFLTNVYGRTEGNLNAMQLPGDSTTDAPPPTLK